MYHIKQDCDSILRDGTSADIDVIDYILEVSTSRMRRQLSRSDVRIVSLGESCLPRTIPTKWGLKMPRLLGEPSMPFDLAVHSVDAVINALSNEFRGYIDIERLQRHEGGFPIDLSQGIQWNHEVGDEWFVNGFEKLSETYTRRIVNLQAAFASKRSIALFYTENYITKETEERLIDAVASLEEKGGVCLLIVTTAVDKPDLTTSEMNGITVARFHHPLPYQGYEWWQHNHFSSKQGLEWERSIVTVIDQLQS